MRQGPKTFKKYVGPGRGNFFKSARSHYQPQTGIRAGLGPRQACAELLNLVRNPERGIPAKFLRSGTKFRENAPGSGISGTGIPHKLDPGRLKNSEARALPGTKAGLVALVYA